MGLCHPKDLHLHSNVKKNKQKKETTGLKFGTQKAW